MTTPTLTPAEPTSRTSKISREHLVLGAILAVVVIGAAAWFLTKGGGGGTAAPQALPTKPAAVTATTTPPAAVVPVAKKPAVTAKKAAFLKAGNKICTTMNAKENALGEEPTTPAAEAKFLAKTASYTARALAQLRALHAPAGDAARLKTMFNDVVRLNGLTASAGKALLAGDKKTAEGLLNKVPAAARKANAAFNAYGLTVCGS
jgi:hypothetical protein